MADPNLALYILFWQSSSPGVSKSIIWLRLRSYKIVHIIIVNIVACSNISKTILLADSCQKETLKKKKKKKKKQTINKISKMLFHVGA